MGITVISIFVFQGLIFLGLIFMLRQFMKENIKNQLGHLKKLNEELIRKQAELQQRTAAIEEEYKDKTLKLKEEITAKQTQVRQESAQTLERERQKAIQERERIIAEAVETREKMRHEVMAEMEGKAIQYSKEILAQLLTGKLRRALHEALTEELIEALESVNMEHFQIQSDAAANLKVAEPLNEDVIHKLGELIKKKIKKEVQFREEIDETLLGGLILQLGSFVIDGSMSNRLRESAAILKKETHRRYQSAL